MENKIVALQRHQFIEFTERELRRLHDCVEEMCDQKYHANEEDLELKDLEARLATAIELPVNVKEVLLQLVPEHLRDAVNRLLRNGDQHVAVAVWCEDDVFERAKERGLTATREQAQEILAGIDREQDAELGITWVTIDCCLDELEEKQKLAI